MTTQTLSPLADAIVEAYWILCEPAHVVGRALDEFAEYQRHGRPFTWDDQPVDPVDFIMALDEIVRYFDARQMWPIERVGSN